MTNETTRVFEIMNEMADHHIKEQNMTFQEYKEQMYADLMYAVIKTAIETAKHQRNVAH